MLWIPKGMYQNLITEAEIWTPLETGGVFMGYISVNQDMVVTDMIGAGDNAIHKECGFEPDQDYQLEEIEKIYYESNGIKKYLGDWHTHPNSTTSLSLKDKRTLTRIASTPESNNLHPIMVILGGGSKGWSMNAVQFISGRIYLWSYVVCNYRQLPHTLFEQN